MGVNATVVAMVLASTDPLYVTSPLVAGPALLLAALLAGTQIALALALGHRLRDGAPTGLPARSAFGLGAALAVLSTSVGWLIYSWTQDRMPDAEPQLAVLLGTTLAVAAWVAPWVLVNETLSSQPPRHRGSAEGEALRSAAALALAVGRSAQQRAHRLVARTAQRTGVPPRASWSQALRQLDEATIEAEARYRMLVADDLPSGPIGRDDVDLAS